MFYKTTKMSPTHHSKGWIRHRSIISQGGRANAIATDNSLSLEPSRTSVSIQPPLERVKHRISLKSEQFLDDTNSAEGLGNSPQKAYQEMLAESRKHSQQVLMLDQKEKDVYNRLRHLTTTNQNSLGD